MSSQYGGPTEGASIFPAISPAKPNCRDRECLIYIQIHLVILIVSVLSYYYRYFGLEILLDGMMEVNIKILLECGEL